MWWVIIFLLNCVLLILVTILFKEYDYFLVCFKTYNLVWIRSYFTSWATHRSWYLVMTKQIVTCFLSCTHILCSTLTYVTYPLLWVISFLFRTLHLTKILFFLYCLRYSFWELIQNLHLSTAWFPYLRDIKIPL